MYLILDKVNRVIDITSEVRYVKAQKNGKIVICPKAEADAVYSLNTDRFYSLEASGYNIECYCLSEAEEVPAEAAAGYCHYSNGGIVVSTADRIALLRQKLADSDYQAIKHSEGVLSAEEYGPVRLQRQAWRDEINELEAGSAALDY